MIFRGRVRTVRRFMGGLGKKVGVMTLRRWTDTPMHLMFFELNHDIHCKDMVDI